MRHEDRRPSIATIRGVGPVGTIACRCLSPRVRPVPILAQVPVKGRITRKRTRAASRDARSNSVLPRGSNTSAPRAGGAPCAPCAPFLRYIALRHPTIAAAMGHLAFCRWKARWPLGAARKCRFESNHELPQRRGTDAAGYGPERASPLLLCSALCSPLHPSPHHHRHPHTSTANPTTTGTCSCGLPISLSRGLPTTGIATIRSIGAVSAVGGVGTGGGGRRHHRNQGSNAGLQLLQLPHCALVDGAQLRRSREARRRRGHDVEDEPWKTETCYSTTLIQRLLALQNQPCA